MTLSLIHLLAARACHADTLKRALLHNPEACRLLAYFGVTPTHLEDIAKGDTSRLRAATSTTLADYLLLSARLMAGGLDGAEAAMLRGQMEAPWRALTPKEHEAVRVVGALYDRLAKLQAERGDIRTQADFEYRLAEADEHVRVTEKRLLHAAEFENEVLTLLGVEYRSEALDAIRALHGRLAAQTEPPAAHERDGMRPEHRLARIRRLFGFSDETLESDLVQWHRDYRTLLNGAESTDAAITPDTIADLLALPDYVRVEVWPVGDSFNARAVRQADGAVNAMGNTPREALIALYNHITDHVTPKATKPTTPPEPIVLGPWRALVQGGAMSFRSVVGGTIDGVRVSADGWAVYDRAGSCVCHGEETGQAGRDAADKWARGNGYVLIDAEPGSLKGELIRWDNREKVSIGITVDERCTIFAYKYDHGWRIRANGAPIETPTAHGPQTGEEGKRYALAAAHALGLTGGGE